MSRRVGRVGVLVVEATFAAVEALAPVKQALADAARKGGGRSRVLKRSAKALASFEGDDAGFALLLISLTA